MNIVKSKNRKNRKFKKYFEIRKTKNLGSGEFYYIMKAFAKSLEASSIGSTQKLRGTVQ